MTIKMKQLKIIVISLLGGLLLVSPVYAEDVLSDLDGGDDIVIEQDESSSFSRFWDEHGSATVGGFYLAGGDSGKQLAFLTAGFNYEWEMVKFNIEGSALSSTTTLGIDEDFTDQNRSEIEIKRDKIRLISAYLDFQLLDNLSLAVGRQSIVWGQFDIFSPVDFALPMDFDFAGQSIGKLGNRMPQDTVKVSWFPIESLEVQGYYFPTLENMFEDNDELLDNLIEPDNDDQTAFRVLYYHDWGTIGVTYYDGFNHFWPSEIADYDATAGGGFDSRVNERNEIYKNTMIGLELSKPIGRYTIKAEVAKHDHIEELNTPYENGSSFNEYVAWLGLKNNNRLYVEADVYFSAIGVEADLDRWKYSISLINRTVSYDSDQQTGVDLSDANDRDTDGDEGGNTFPTLFVQYFFQDERTSHIGFGAGMLSGYMGVTLYYSQEVIEALNIFVGYEFGMYWGDSNSGDDEDVELEEFIGGPKIGLSYQF